MTTETALPPPVGRPETHPATLARGIRARGFSGILGASDGGMRPHTRGSQT